MTTTINLKDLSIRDSLTKVFKIISIILDNDSSNVPTPAEIVILTEFMALPEKYDNRRFGKVARIKVSEKVYGDPRSNRSKVTNKIYSLMKKGFIVEDEDGVYYAHPTIDKVTKEIKQANIEGKTFTLKMDLQYEYSPLKSALQGN